ncbi:MAG: hypothetical protein ACLSHG_01610 [Oscillospiraceae bacterium]
MTPSGWSRALKDADRSGSFRLVFLAHGTSPFQLELTGHARPHAAV